MIGTVQLETAMTVEGMEPAEARREAIKRSNRGAETAPAKPLIRIIYFGE
jgi:hypothetical protein